MKKIIKAFLLFLIVALLFASCEAAAPTQETERPTKITEAPTDAITEAPTDAITEAPTDALTDASTDVTTEALTKEQEPSVDATEAPTQEQEPAIDINPLILDDYDDFLLFRKGELDVHEAYYLWYGSDPKTLIDIRALLNLPELPNGWQGAIIFQSDDGFYYSVGPIDENGIRRTEYSVILTYDSDGFTVDNSFFPTIDGIKANTENQKYFSIRKNESVLLYHQDNGVYQSLIVIFDKYKVSFDFLLFEESGYTPAQIKETCGALVASLFSENEEEFSRGVETIANAFSQTEAPNDAITEVPTDAITEAPTQEQEPSVYATEAPTQE